MCLLDPVSISNLLESDEEEEDACIRFVQSWKQAFISKMGSRQNQEAERKARFLSPSSSSSSASSLPSAQPHHHDQDQDLLKAIELSLQPAGSIKQEEEEEIPEWVLQPLSPHPPLFRQAVKQEQQPSVISSVGSMQANAIAAPPVSQREARRLLMLQAIQKRQIS